MVLPSPTELAEQADILNREWNGGVHAAYNEGTSKLAEVRERWLKGQSAKSTGVSVAAVPEMSPEVLSEVGRILKGASVLGFVKERLGEAGFVKFSEWPSDFRSYFLGMFEEARGDQRRIRAWCEFGARCNRAWGTGKLAAFVAVGLAVQVFSEALMAVTSPDIADVSDNPDEVGREFELTADPEEKLPMPVIPGVETLPVVPGQIYGPAGSGVMVGSAGSGFPRPTCAEEVAGELSGALVHPTVPKFVRPVRTLEPEESEGLVSVPDFPKETWSNGQPRKVQAPKKVGKK